jgi:hypothetical protein
MDGSHVGSIHKDIHNSFWRASKTFCTFLAHRNVHAISHLYVSELLMFLLLARYAIRLYQVREPCGAVVQESDCDGHNDINDTNGERRRRFIHLPSAAQRTKPPTENAS